MTKIKTAIIIGGGPAGLTAAYELLVRTNIKPIIFESTNAIGGLARTINYKGNRFDIGGHRFFSKSQRINNWWSQFFPLHENCLKPNNIMMLRQRLSRIYFLGKFFDYPISLNINTINNLGFIRCSYILWSYLLAKISPIKPESSLEDFFINHFGQELYNIFFKDYTEKLWGINCKDIDAAWGTQRICKLSIYKTLMHAVKKKLHIKNRNCETSLIEQFMYPKFGPGQFWETVADKILELGGEIHQNSEVIKLGNFTNKITYVLVSKDGLIKESTADYFFSSMPIKDLLLGFNNKIPANVFSIGTNLPYRSFITVGILLKNLPENFQDNWIYIQERTVKLGRIQIFNNWSPYLAKDPQTIWLGLEYFCFAGDEFWSMADADIINFATSELKKIFSLDDRDIIDSTIVRVTKAYPAYFGVYNQLDIVKNYLNHYENLFLIGRNGMHRYNNMDHSMLTAMIAVDNIINNITSKDNIWAVNADPQYHER